MIDKEKLLKELPCAKGLACEGSSCRHFTSGERTTKCMYCTNKECTKECDRRLTREVETQAQLHGKMLSLCAK